MAKVGLITPRPEDTRFRARITRFFQKLLGSGGEKSPQWNSNILIPCVVAFVIAGILSFALLINVLPLDWLTVTQMVLISAVLGIIASIIVAIFLFSTTLALLTWGVL
ncbi:hypothetical protein [Sinorhizobium alkalisoli]|uniref:hypothetical protein n=1 Tax=Sinorhizobium alkalisoli TaxID=1752398 RepID=UPI001041EC18|nr:hypothetical protein [Sinorhizobium alkalisoli]